MRHPLCGENSDAGGLRRIARNWKTTIAQKVARRCQATYLRIDTIEQAIRSANILTGEVGPSGYLVGYALAETNLTLGQVVIVDSVNAVKITRASWRSVAAAANCPILEVEIICTDLDEHRRRVETRTIDIPNLTPPTWAAVVARDYEPWPEARIRIDTAVTGADEAASTILSEIELRQKPGQSHL